MARLVRLGAMGVLAAALMPGCLGGQTGQPSSLECESTDVAPTAAWSGITVQEAAAAFEGTYRAGLQWHAESRYALPHTDVAFSDSVQLTIDDAGDAVREDCTAQLHVSVWVTIATSSSGIADSGPATLTIHGSANGLVGVLEYSSALLRLGATLDEAARGVAPSGGLDALNASQFPGASATFTEVP